MTQGPTKSVQEWQPPEAAVNGHKPCDIAATMERVLSRLAEYRPQADSDLVRRAFAFACEKHAGQTRSSGEPYITHPVEVTEILADLEMDEQTLAAGLLHDVIEDCGVTV